MLCALAFFPVFFPFCPWFSASHVTDALTTSHAAARTSQSVACVESHLEQLVGRSYHACIAASGMQSTRAEQANRLQRLFIARWFSIRPINIKARANWSKQFLPEPSLVCGIALRRRQKKNRGSRSEYDATSMGNHPAACMASSSIIRSKLRHLLLIRGSILILIYFPV